MIGTESTSRTAGTPTTILSGTGDMRHGQAVAMALAAVGVTLALASAPAWGVQLGVGIAMVAGGLVLRSRPEA